MFNTVQNNGRFNKSIVKSIVIRWFLAQNLDQEIKYIIPVKWKKQRQWNGMIVQINKKKNKMHSSTSENVIETIFLILFLGGVRLYLAVTHLSHVCAAGSITWQVNPPMHLISLILGKCKIYFGIIWAFGSTSLRKKSSLLTLN